MPARNRAWLTEASGIFQLVKVAEEQALDPEGAALPPFCAQPVPAHLPCWVSVTPSPGRRRAFLASSVHRAHSHPQDLIVHPDGIFQAVSGDSGDPGALALAKDHPEYCPGIMCELTYHSQWSG